MYKFKTEKKVIKTVENQLNLRNEVLYNRNRIK